MKALLEYLRKTYDPLGMIVYGSYSNGTQTEESDFDALLICREGEYAHDTSTIDGVLLDVFVYPENVISGIEEYDAFVQIYDGIVVHDEPGTATRLMQRVRAYVDGFPVKTHDEKEELKAWCYKMLQRTKRADAEGAYRAHWLLADSLEIYCNIRDMFYFGPKKTIYAMKHNDPMGFSLLSRALSNKTELDAWIKYIFEAKEICL